MDIELDLSRHCIETELKILHNRAVKQYFKSKQDRPEIEKRLVILKRALEELDFPALRSMNIILSGHNDNHASVVLSDQGDSIGISINGVMLNI